MEFKLKPVKTIPLRDGRSHRGKWVGYVVPDSEAYRWYWIGKSPKVRRATEQYIENSVQGSWNRYEGTQRHIAAQHGIHKQSIIIHMNILRNRGLIVAVTRSGETYK